MTISSKGKRTVLSIAAFVLTASATLAAPAIATGGVNVRTGPSTQYAKVDTLFKGENVDVKQCQSGWCYIQHSGPDGWVSANYLAEHNKRYKKQKPKRHHNQQPDINFGFGFNDGSVSFGFGIGSGGGIHFPNQQSEPTNSKQACVYSKRNFKGKKRCYASGKVKGQLNGFWDDNISSIKVRPGATISLCSNQNLNGRCRSYSHSKQKLPHVINNEVSSLAVY